MPASIGVNLRVTGHCRQGGRKYMEDFFSVAYQQTEDEKDLEYAFFGIYDGHGGAEAAAFAKEHLMETIIKHKSFWSDCDEDVLRAIKDGYIATHYAMWREREKWPCTASGLPSTAGTTASVAFIRRGKIYIGHVGDSGIVLGYQEPGSSEWKAKPLTRDHKPENAEEMSRIVKCGGKVMCKSGVPRVVWNRPKIGHQGPVRRSTPIDEIPFLAVARSLGDLWSYNSQIDRFIVSPDPDCSVLKIDTDVHRCLIFGTDGLYNMLSPTTAVHIVQQAERHNETAALSDSTYKTWMNPSKLLVEKAMERWHATKMRADNTSVVTLMLDPPGPPRAQVLIDRKKNLPERGLKIMTRFDGSQRDDTKEAGCSTACSNLVPSGDCDTAPADAASCSKSSTERLESILEPVIEVVPAPIPVTPEVLNAAPKDVTTLELDMPESPASSNKECLTASSNENAAPVSTSDLNVSNNSCSHSTNFPLKERNFLPKPRESTSFDPRDPLQQTPCFSPPDDGKENQKSNMSSPSSVDDNTIQCNEVSSSNIEVDSIEDENESTPNIKSAKHNLRSTKKESRSEEREELSNSKDDSKGKPVKRKLDVDVVPQPRKSLRIDGHQKKVTDTTKENLEEKTKQKLTPSESILKAKPIDMKKKSILKKTAITKNKVQVVLQKLKNRQKTDPAIENEEPIIEKQKSTKAKSHKLPKVIATKVGFQKNLRNTVPHDQRNKSDKNETKETRSKSVKTKGSVLEKGSSNTDQGGSSETCSSSSESTKTSKKRSSPGNNFDFVNQR
ncbi:unnamed protein product [Acanthoscelides obtectus]|uniref:PPM-type phosphatase domain-containing protein n=1 Tax=Acanthoscelides obtectus TaxID=200917 RepID=A0A9P0KTV2_ACAOB|nr:unnamed protein product [Acanthoscelides obtectus]CAK1645672.1 Protein phosphatase 1D [Acanthoscelides obtectus]